ncbi:hypothetical protein H1R20_g11692, partial [Candolleomyces eurysporus]
MASSLRNLLSLHRMCTRQRLSVVSSAEPSSSRILARSFSRSCAAASAPASSKSKPLSILEDDDAEIDLSEDNEVVNGARPGTPPVHSRKPPPNATPEEWRKHREAIKKRFPDGWSPPRKISRDAMDGLRQLYNLNPETFTTQVLAEKFRISPEAVRRILKSKWEPSQKKKEKLVLREKEHRKQVKTQRTGKIKAETLPFAKEEKVARPKRDRLTMV